MDQATMTIMVAIISLCIAGAGVAVSYYQANHRKSQDDQQAATLVATELTKLSGNIKALEATMLEMKFSMNEDRGKIDKHTEKIIILERDMKTCFNKLDESSKRMDRIETRQGM